MRLDSGALFVCCSVNYVMPKRFMDTAAVGSLDAHVASVDGTAVVI